MAALAACSLTTSLDGLTSNVVYADAAGEGTGADGEALPDGSLPGADAGTDAPATADADGGTVAGVNIHPQSTFETADAACGPGWGTYQSSLEKNAVAHGGTASCRVCMNSGILDFYTADDGGSSGATTLGVRYRAEAWVRTAPGFPSPGPGRLFLRNFKVTGGFEDLESKSSDAVMLDFNWRLVSTELLITKPGGVINVFIGMDAVAGSCFLIDDVTLRRVN